jgi:hypothetical protein
VKLKLLSVSAALFVSILLPTRASYAQQLQPLEPELVRQMLQEGWQKVADGVLQRTTDDRQTETFTYGEDGLRWTARRLEARLGFLQNEYNSHPSADLAGIIENIKAQLIDVDQSLKAGLGQAEMPTGEDIAACTISYDAQASASALTSSQGTAASAYANYSSTCGQLGNTYAYAYARATSGTLTTTHIQEDPKYNGTSLTSTGNVSSPGSTDCYSEAFARTWSPTLNIDYSVSQVNYSCPPPVSPFSVSASGPSDVYTDDYTPCQIVTWTATPSGGTSPYTYDWYIGGTYQASGSSLSRKYCGFNGSVTVTVYAHDSSSPVQYANSSYTTYFQYYPSCSSNCGCNTSLQRPYEEQMICPYY